MIGVVVPAHNEAEHLASCLLSIADAARHPGLYGETVAVTVVLDACTDDTLAIAREHDVRVLSLCAHNVGMARAAGAEQMLTCGARWLAFTDADSRVPKDWLAAQLAAKGDLVCGTVMVDDWGVHSSFVKERYDEVYEYVDGHLHIHGANLGLSTKAYLMAGGFPPVPLAEDVALVDRVLALGLRVARMGRPSVITSARPNSRVSGGFADYLVSLDRLGL